MARLLRLDFKKLDNFPLGLLEQEKQALGEATTMEERNQLP